MFRRNFVVLNAHRVGKPGAAYRLQDDLYDISIEEFTRQLSWLRERVTWIGENDLLKFSPTTFDRNKPLAMLTFDDGYRCNLEVVVPILEEFGVPAIFFVPTQTIETGRLPFWDLVSFACKESARRNFIFRGIVFSLEPGHREATIAKINNIFLRLDDYFPVLEDLYNQLEVALPSLDWQRREILNWTQVAEIKRRGFSIGSHGETHRMLSALNRERKQSEVFGSRQVLAAKGFEAHSFAIPYGQANSFSEDDLEIIKGAGYKFIFHYRDTCNYTYGLDPFRIDRIFPKRSTFKLATVMFFPQIYSAWKIFRRGRSLGYR
jgi:peptidoglycan/xylan/chitin deacetylase (PgdA/CDA1 family)